MMSAYMDDYDRELMERSRTALAEAEAAYEIRRAAWMAAQALAEEEARSSRRSIRASSLGAHAGIKKKKTKKNQKNIKCKTGSPRIF